MERVFSQSEIEKKHANVHFHGKYSLEDLERISPEIHVSLHLSIWPETYCISLSEMWDLGIVPVVSDLGALGERVKDHVNGYKIRPGNVTELIGVLNSIHQHPEVLERLRSGLVPDLSVSANQCAEVHRGIYENLDSSVSVNGNILSEGAPHSWVIARKKRRLHRFVEKMKSHFRGIFH